MFGLKEPNKTADALTEIYRVWIGGRGNSCGQIADAANIPQARTVQCHIAAPATRAKDIHLLQYMALLGPEFVNDVLALIGMGGAHETEARCYDAKTAAANTASYLAAKLHWLEDGRIDHRERPQLIKAAEAHLVDTSRLLQAARANMLEAA